MLIFFCKVMAKAAFNSIFLSSYFISKRSASLRKKNLANNLLLLFYTLFCRAIFFFHAKLKAEKQKSMRPCSFIFLKQSAL